MCDTCDDDLECINLLYTEGVNEKTLERCRQRGWSLYRNHNGTVKFIHEAKAKGHVRSLTQMRDGVRPVASFLKFTPQEYLDHWNDPANHIPFTTESVAEWLEGKYGPKSQFGLEGMPHDLIHKIQVLRGKRER